MERFELSQGLGREILDMAKAKGASQGDAVMAESDSFFVTVRMGEVEKISQAGEKRLGLRLFFGNSSASASTSDISKKSIEKLVDDTARMAKVTAQDPHGGLPDAAVLAREVPELDLLDDSARAIPVDEKIQLALDTEKSALAYDARITNSEGAEFSNHFSRVIYVSSQGFAGEYSGSTFGHSVAPVASQNGSMQRDYWYSSNRKYAKLESPKSVGERAAQRVLRRLGARKIKTCVRKKVVVDEGTLKSYLLDTYSGKKLGMASTGNASRSIGEAPGVSPANFYLAPGRERPEDIIGSVTAGLYVTEMIGFGVNMVTGDYSRGAAGMWIENGELAYPVEEITIAGNLKEMFQNIERVGNDLEMRGRICAPTLKISRMTVAGN